MRSKEPGGRVEPGEKPEEERGVEAIGREEKSMGGGSGAPSEDRKLAPGCVQ